MEPEDPHGVRLLPVLIAGLSLLVLMLAGSFYIEIDAIRSTESGAARLVEGQRSTLRLIDQIQREEDSLSAVFYELAANPNPGNQTELLKRLETLEHAIRRTMEEGLLSEDQKLWSDVKSGVERFIAEGRAVLKSQHAPPIAFFRSHEALISSLGALAAASFDTAAQAQAREREGSRERVRYSLILLGTALTTALAGAILTVRIVSQMFRRQQWQTLELSRLSSRAMADQEETARRFSRELHDEFGQALSAIEANLVTMHNTRQYHPVRMEDCLALIKNAIENTRDLSQLLRPSILDDFGLNAGLRWVADVFSQRTDIKVEFETSLHDRLSDETETQLFRIAQEALTNVGRHANATAVRMQLTPAVDHVVLTVSDNGEGVRGSGRREGLGLVGMRARARAAGGTFKMDSIPGKGVTITVKLPLKRKSDAA
ncbi:MAG TPA: sensor histidine kinase [Bryobacteraceae bacterium]|nr:sensor histidine kinase [Bryobacteraceae bacterium]